MANDINIVTIIGRLTRDSELKYTNTGTAIAKFSIANGKKRKSGEQWIDEVSYFDVVLWGKVAESLNQYLLKGKQVGVSGELRQNRWEQEGQNRSKVEIVAHSIQLMGDSHGVNNGTNAPQQQNNQQNTQRRSNDVHDFDDDDLDAIPF